MLEIPFQVKKVRQTETFGEFIIEPLPQGYGHTLGNALRRVLLSSLPGVAITQAKIGGVKHRFSTLEGMKEDVIELLLNVKQIRLKYEGEKPIHLYLEKTGPGMIKAEDIQAPGGAEIINKELVLVNMADRKSKLKMQMVAERGFGYLPIEGRKSDKLGVILLDAIFSPIKTVNYKVEPTRVGRQTDLDKLVLEITTDGTIKPHQALKEATKVLIGFFNQIIKPKEIPLKVEETVTVSDEVLKLTVEELELPTRIVNALRKAGYETLRDLAAATVVDLSKVKNLGEKSTKIIHTALVKKGVASVDTKGKGR